MGGNPLADQQRTRTTEVDAVEAADNDSGLTVVNDRVGGRPFVTVYYAVSGNAEIEIEGSNDDGANWRPIDTLDTAESNTDTEATEPYPFYAFDEIRATTDTTDIAVEFEVSATR